MFNTSIKSKVAKAIKAKITKAEAEYKSFCDTSDKELEQKKIDKANELVKSIVG